jgi:glutamine cyclotransferase
VLVNQLFKMFFAALIALPASVLIISCSNSKTSETPAVYTYKVVKTYSHDPKAFTQGLAFENGLLYESTGLHGSSTLRKVEFETGRVLQMYKLPAEFFAEGITIYRDKIIQLTYRSNVGFVYKKDTFEFLERFNYSTEGWGITYDGKRLVMSDGTSTLRFLDPETFEQSGRIEVHDNNRPVSGLNELEYVKGQIFANVWPTELVVRISPQTGEVTGWIYLTGLLSLQDTAQPIDVLNGIAYDATDDRLFVTGKFWPRLFEIKLVPLE